MYSNGYIFRYASIVVILAAALLSFASVVLKPFQQRNIQIDKMSGILAAAKIPNVTTEDAIPLFNKYIVEEQVVSPNGDILSDYKKSPKEDAPAFKISLKTELYNKKHGKPYKLPVYIAEVNNQKIYIIPLYGQGLWGPIWGNVALRSDMKTIVGVFFDDQEETPGLGGEIKSAHFKNQFVGKTIFDKHGKFTSIIVKKGGIEKLPANMRIHGVDALSGATLTSNGVNDMFENVLSSYLSYIKKHS